MNSIDLSPIITSTAARYQLDPDLVHAVVQQESSGNPGAINRAGGGQGAYGAMQVRGPALTDYNRAHGTSYSLQDLLDPAKGIDVGSWYLNQQLNTFNDPAAALSAYKNGAGSPEAKAGTSAYAQQVLSRIGSLSTATAPDTSGYGGAPAPASQSGGPAVSNSGVAAVLSQFGYGADGKPQAAAASSSGAPASQGAAAQPSGAAAILSQFGYGADGQPAPASQAPANQPVVPAKMPAPIASQQTPLAAKQDFLRNVMGVGTPEEASNWQNYAPGAIVSGIGNVVGGTSQKLAHGAQTLANTFLSPGSPLARMANQWAASEDADATQRAQNGPTSASGKVGELVGESIPAGFLPGGTLMRAVTGGALAGGMQPITQNADQNFWAQTGVQMALGAGLGGAGHAIFSGLGSLVNRFAQPESEAMTLMRQALNGQKLTAEPQPTVPGVQPTLAELTGNANVAVAQRQVDQANPDPFRMRAEQNTQARQDAFDNAVKSPQEAEMAANEGAQKARWQYENSGVGALSPDAELAEILQRQSMQPVLRRAELLAGESGAGNPFQAQRDALRTEQNQAFADLAGTPEGVAAARATRDADVFDRYQAAGAQELPVDETLQSLMQRPAMQRSISRAQELSNEEGAGPLFTEDEGGGPMSLTGDAAHYIKMGLDDEIQRAPQNNLGAHAQRLIRQTKEQFLGWLDNQSPDYASARASYAEQTQPIEAQEYLQGLNVTDANGNVILSKLDTALKNTEKLRAQPGLNAAKNLTDDQLAQMNTLRDNLRAAQGGPDVSRFTPDQIQYVQRALDDEIARGTRGATANENQVLTQSRSDLENWLGQRAPDYLASKQTSQASQQGLETNQYLQKDISDSMGRLQLNRVEQKIKQIEDAKRLGADTPAARVDDKTLNALRAIRDSFRVENNADAMTKGPATNQNKEWTAALRLGRKAADVNPLAAAVSRATGAATGAATGWAAGNLVAPGLGGVVGTAVGGLVGGSLERRAAQRAVEQEQSRLATLVREGTDMFLHPTPELINQLNNTPSGQRLMHLIDMARARAPGLAGVVGGGPIFRGATQ
jgi:hypothetical protein